MASCAMLLIINKTIMMIIGSMLLQHLLLSGSMYQVHYIHHFYLVDKQENSYDLYDFIQTSFLSTLSTETFLHPSSIKKFYAHLSHCRRSMGCTVSFSNDIIGLPLLSFPLLAVSFPF